MNRKSGMRRHITSILRLLFSLSLMAILFWTTDVSHLHEHLQDANLLIYALGLAVFWLSLMIWSARWIVLLHGVGEAVRFRTAISTLLVGMFFALFLPSVVGQDLGRMHELSRRRENKIGIVSTVLLDRLIGLVSLVLIALFALIIVGYRYVNTEIIYAIVGTTIGLGLLWVLFFNRRFMRLFRSLLRLPVIRYFEPVLKQLYEALYVLQCHRRMVIGALVISIAFVLVETLSVVVLSYAIGATINSLYFFIFVPMIWLITALPISIGGLGVRETAFTFFFVQVGMASHEAILVSLLYFSFYLVAGLVGAIIFVQSSVGALVSSGHQESVLAGHQPGELD